MFNKILIANRGEIACRVMETARAMGVKTVAVFSDADADAKHVAIADEAIHIGGPAPADSYLRGDAIIAAAHATGAQAIHPGYGFLSENADFANMVEEHGFTFIGPKPEHITLMGDKIAAKQAVMDAGIPVVPVAIYGSAGVRGWKRFRFPAVTIRYGEALTFPVEDDSDRDRQLEVANEIFDQVKEMYADFERLGRKGSLAAAKSA